MTENPGNSSQDIIQERVKRDSGIGAPVVLTFITDSLGCFIFIGLDTLLP